MFASIVRSSALSAFASVSTYLILITLARNGSVEFAAFSYAAVCGLVLVMVADLAADQVASMFMLTSGVAHGTALRVVLQLKLVVVSSIFVVLVVTTVVFQPALIPLRSLCFLVPAFYIGPLFELRGRNAEFAALLAVEKLSLLAACVAYILLRGFDDGIYVLHAAASLGSCIYQWRRFGSVVRGAAPGSFDLIADYARRYWPVYVSLFAHAAYGHASRLIIEARLGLMTFASVSLALQTLNALSIAQSQIDRHFRPALNLAAAARDLAALRALWWKYARWYVSPLAVAACLIYVLAEPIVGVLFGEHWRAAARPLAVLVPLIVTVPVLRFVDTIAVSIGAQRLMLAVNVAAAIVLVAVLSTLSVDRPLDEWLRYLIVVQALHAAVGGLVVGRAVSRVAQPRASGPLV